MPTKGAKGEKEREGCVGGIICFENYMKRRDLIYKSEEWVLPFSPYVILHILQCCVILLKIGYINGRQMR